MKMRKLLATAVAATMAVTSLATVASAAEKSWNMGHTTGTIKLEGTQGGEVSFLAADQTTPALGISSVTENYSLIFDAAKASQKITGMSVQVTGIKGAKSASSKTYTYALDNYKAAALSKDGKTFTKANWNEEVGPKGDNNTYGTDGSFWVFDAYAYTAAADKFVANQFIEITQIKLIIKGEKTVTDVKVYDKWGVDGGTWGEGLSGVSVVKGATVAVNGWDTNKTFDAAPADSVVGAMANLFNGAPHMSYSEKTTTVDYPFMPVTETKGDSDKLGRDEIRVLSVTGAWDSYDRGEADTDKDGNGANQSYDGDNTVDGQVKRDFAGLASQVADFFNKQTNGTITFKFTTGAEAGGTAWENGGIPSTQTGIKNFMGDATANDFALFINYKQTGSLQAITELDKDAGTVTFDISDILDAMGGQTLGVVDNIYYGLRKGIEYKDHGTGLMVETVTLAYDEDADVEADIEDDAEVEDDADVEIEEDDDVEIEDDADDAVEEDDADAAGDVVVEEEDDDANPGTGVALAVAPLMTAAAAVVLSKKRK